MFGLLPEHLIAKSRNLDNDIKGFFEGRRFYKPKMHVINMRLRGHIIVLSSQNLLKISKHNFNSNLCYRQINYQTMEWILTESRWFKVFSSWGSEVQLVNLSLSNLSAALLSPDLTADWMRTWLSRSTWALLPCIFCNQSNLMGLSRRKASSKSFSANALRPWHNWTPKDDTNWAFQQSGWSSRLKLSKESRSFWAYNRMNFSLILLDLYSQMCTLPSSCQAHHTKVQSKRDSRKINWP